MRRSVMFRKLIESFQIRRQDLSVAPLRFNEPQERVWKMIEERLDNRKNIWLIILKARRLGMSTLCEGLMLARTLMEDHVHSLVMASNAGNTNEVWRMASTMIDHSPWKGYAYKARKEILLGRSKLTVATAATPDAVRGWDLTCVHGSETAFWERPETLLAALQCIPDNIDTFCFLESTANGKTGIGELFYEEWKRASDPKEGSDFIPIFLPWHSFTRYQRVGWQYADDYVQKPKKVQLVLDNLTDEEREMRSTLNLTAPQLAWRRWAISTKCQGNLDKFNQEYPCLVGETYVSTDAGIQPLKSVMGIYGESGTITAWSENPPTTIYKLLTHNGRILRGTGHHPVMTPDGFIPLSDLKTGQTITLRAPRFADHPFHNAGRKMDHDVARFLGYFMGDGSCNDRGVSIICDGRDREVIEDVRGLLVQFVGKAKSRIHQHSDGPGAVEWRSYNRRSVKWLTMIGAVQKISHKKWKRNVVVPECVLRSPQPIVRQFLKGLFESDGSSTQRMVRWACKSLDFARQVQLLLLGFGINAKIHENHRTLNGKTHCCYVIQLTSIQSRIFHDTIGFISERKQKGRFAGSHVGRPPVSNEMVDVVQSVTTDGQEITYDLTVEPDHIFMANGILTHNTTAEMAFIQAGLPFFRRGDLLPFYTNLKKGKRYIIRDQKLVPDPQGYFEVFTEPKAGGQYVVGADTSFGFNEKARSRSTAQVLDMETLEQVAEYEAATAPHVQARHLATIGRYYNNAVLAPEVQASGGGGGKEIIVYLRALDYWNIYIDTARSADKVGRKPMVVYGWETNSKTRPRMISRLREVISERSTVIRSERLLTQIGSIGENESHHVEALQGHDDLLFAYMIALVVRVEVYTAMKPGAGPPTWEKSLESLGLDIQEYDFADAFAKHREKVLKGDKTPPHRSYLEM